jgi:hypothetical protein
MESDPIEIRMGTGVATLATFPGVFSAQSLIVGAAAPISVFAVRSDGARVPVPQRSARFASSDDRIARVATDSAGLIAVGTGTADVTVTIRIGSQSVATTVHVFVGNILSGQ